MITTRGEASCLSREMDSQQGRSVLLWDASYERYREAPCVTEMRAVAHVTKISLSPRGVEGLITDVTEAEANCSALKLQLPPIPFEMVCFCTIFLLIENFSYSLQQGAHFEDRCKT